LLDCYRCRKLALLHKFFTILQALPQSRSFFYHTAAMDKLLACMLLHQHAAFCFLAHFLLNLQTISFSDTSKFCFDSDGLQRAFDVANQILNEYHLSKTIYYKKIASKISLCDTGPTTEVDLF
jgi:hypothetical protein